MSESVRVCIKGHDEHWSALVEDSMLIPVEIDDTTIRNMGFKALPHNRDYGLSEDTVYGCYAWNWAPSAARNIYLHASVVQMETLTDTLEFWAERYPQPK